MPAKQHNGLCRDNRRIWSRFGLRAHLLRNVISQHPARPRLNSFSQKPLLRRSNPTYHTLLKSFTSYSHVSNVIGTFCFEDISREPQHLFQKLITVKGILSTMVKSFFIVFAPFLFYDIRDFGHIHYVVRYTIKSNIIPY